jgi:TetR/AcrR family fatty acid metabolism transcriptional regulator
MVRAAKPKRMARQPRSQSYPPGHVKIVKALRSLLMEKEFNAITWSDIAQTAGVNEGLIYKYFKDKRNLLHKVLEEYFKEYLAKLESDLKGIDGALNKLRKLIWSVINASNEDRVFARIIFLEVRNFPGYFESQSYRLVQDYAQTIKELIQEGIRTGEIRKDISPWHLRQIILGSIEHLCLPGVIFQQEIDAESLTEELCKILFTNIGTHRN